MFVEMTDQGNLSKAKFTDRYYYQPAQTTLSQVKLCINSFTQTLNMLNSCESIFCALTIINLLSLNNNDYTTCYFACIWNIGFVPITASHTQVLDGNTIIDNIFVNGVLQYIRILCIFEN